MQWNLSGWVERKKQLHFATRDPCLTDISLRVIILRVFFLQSRLHFKTFFIAEKSVLTFTKWKQNVFFSCKVVKNVLLIVWCMAWWAVTQLYVSLSKVYIWQNDILNIFSWGWINIRERNSGWTLKVLLICLLAEISNIKTIMLAKVVIKAVQRKFKERYT